MTEVRKVRGRKGENPNGPIAHQEVCKVLLLLKGHRRTSQISTTTTTHSSYESCPKTPSSAKHAELASAIVNQSNPLIRPWSTTTGGTSLWTMIGRINLYYQIGNHFGVNSFQFPGLKKCRFSACAYSLRSLESFLILEFIWKSLFLRKCIF